MIATGYSTAFLPTAVPIDEPALLAGAANAQLTAISATLSGPKIQQVGFRATIQKEDPFCSQRDVTLRCFTSATCSATPACGLPALATARPG